MDNTSDSNSLVSDTGTAGTASDLLAPAQAIPTNHEDTPALAQGTPNDQAPTATDHDAWQAIQARTEALRAAITHNATAEDVLRDATTYTAFILGEPTADPAPTPEPDAAPAADQAA